MNKKLIRKMLTAAGGHFTFPGKSLKEVDEINNYNRNKAKGLFKGMISGKVLPTMSNIGSMLGAAYSGWLDTETTAITGNVPNPGMKNPKDVIRLFRATGTSGKFKPSLDGTQEFSGQWFTDNIRKPLRYASSIFKKAKINKESNPVELHVVEIPASEINKYKASELLKGKTDIEYEPTEDFLIPLDYPRLKYPIEGLTGNLLLDMRLKLPIEKQGGKMNILEFLKNGSGIHIKKKNRGKFTSYCGGKVTDECILKGKNSSNPAIRKRATFAANARRWKHLLGGVMKAYEGSKFELFLNSQGGQALIGGLTNLATTAILNKNIKAQAQQQKAQNEMDWATLKKLILKLNQLELDLYYKLWILNYQSGLTKDNPSQIVAEHLGYENLNKQLTEGKELLKNTNNLIDALTNSLISDNWIGTIGNVLLQGMGVVGNYLGLKTPSTSLINSLINDFSSGYNLFTKNSALYNSDKFWNLK